MTDTPLSPLNPDRPPVRRIALGVLLTSLAACLIVTIEGAIGLGVLFLVNTLLGGESTSTLFDTGPLAGVSVALFLCAANILAFLITVPVIALVMSLSLGLMPRRGIVRRAPYLRWAAIWGAIITASVTAFFAGNIDAKTLPGALVTGALIGALAGFLCGHIFFSIVRPDRQLRRVDTSVF